MTLASAESKPVTPRSQAIAPRVGDPMTPPFAVNPPPPPGMDRDTQEQVKRRTRFGILPARIGAHLAVKLSHDEDAAPVEMVVRDVRHFRKATHCAVCVTCGEAKPTAQELVDSHVAKYGNPREMRIKGIAHVYALYSSDIEETMVNGFDVNGQTKSIKTSQPIGFLSETDFADEA